MDQMQRRTLVISAVSFTDGGPLKILQDAVESAVSALSGWDIVVLVNRPGLVGTPGVTELCFPAIKGSWASRIWFELVTCRRISRETRADLWCALHDMTPSVHAKRQVVYCHNPAPFYRHFRIRDFFYDPGFFVFYILYKAVYRNQVHRNYALIVQQTWLRDEFSRFTRHKKIVVSTPAFRGDAAPPAPPEISKCPGNPLVFFYPAVPRVFKNMECVCEAFSQLPSDLQSVIEIRLTTDGTENRYAKFIRRKYGHLPGVRFIGYQGRDGMKRQYADANLLLFPSRLETWGLPITEAKSLGIPLLVADLPYARETVGDCDSVKFISVDDSEAWRDAFIGFQRGTLSFDLSRAVVPAEPSASNWAECWKLISEGL